MTNIYPENELIKKVLKLLFSKISAELNTAAQIRFNEKNQFQEIAEDIESDDDNIVIDENNIEQYCYDLLNEYSITIIDLFTPYEVEDNENIDETGIIRFSIRMTGTELELFNILDKAFPHEIIDYISETLLFDKYEKKYDWEEPRVEDTTENGGVWFVDYIVDVRPKKLSKKADKSSTLQRISEYVYDYYLNNRVHENVAFTDFVYGLIEKVSNNEIFSTWWRNQENNSLETPHRVTLTKRDDNFHPYGVVTECNCDTQSTAQSREEIKLFTNFFDAVNFIMRFEEEHRE